MFELKIDKGVERSLKKLPNEIVANRRVSRLLGDAARAGEQNARLCGGGLQVSVINGLANNDVTLTPGIYDLTLTASSGKYLDALQITGNISSPNLQLRDGTARPLVSTDNFLVHPNILTNSDNAVYGKIYLPNPGSAGCQIVSNAYDFEESVGILHTLGFSEKEKTSLEIKCGK